MQNRLLTRNFKTYTIDKAALQELLQSYTMLWNNTNTSPDKCFLGCPHLSLNQLEWWADKIYGRLKLEGIECLRVKTTICSAPQVLEKFIENKRSWEKLSQAGVKFSSACPMQLFDEDLSKDDIIITNSNKLRTYTHARFFPDEEIVDIVVIGMITGKK